MAKLVKGFYESEITPESLPANEIPLRRKYTIGGGSKKSRAPQGGNNAYSVGKHTWHPDVFAFRRNRYKVEVKWNPKPKDGENET